MGLGVPIYAAALARSYGKGEHASELTNDAPASPAAVRSTSALTPHSTKRIQRRVFVYNRVGKTGSSSMLSLLTSLCLCREFTLPGDWHYWAFDSGDASSDQTTLRQHHLHQAVRSLAATRTEKPCRVLFAHFQWTPLPLASGAAYINWLRNPVARWESIHGFYVQNRWGVTRPDYGRWTARNASACLLEPRSVPNASRACVCARDAKQADYFFSKREQLECPVQTMLPQYAFLGVIEKSAALLPKMLAVLVANASNASSRLDFGSSALRLSHRRRTPAAYKERLSPMAEAVLKHELACDKQLWDAVAESY